MFYQKYFEGSVEAGTTETVYRTKKNDGGQSTYIVANSVVKNRSKIVGDAIVSTLKDCGLPNAYFDQTSCYLYFEKGTSDAGMYVTVEGSYLGIYFGFGYENDDIIDCGNQNYLYYRESRTQFSNTSYSAATYKFYVTIIGDTAGIFSIGIGSYTTPTENSGVALYRGTDKRNNKQLWGFCNDEAISYSMTFIRQDTLEGIIKATNNNIPMMTSVYAPNTSSSLSMLDEWIVLIDAFMIRPGSVVINNTYFNPGLTSGKFYQVNNQVYYCYKNYFIKCITPVTPT